MPPPCVVDRLNSLQRYLQANTDDAKLLLDAADTVRAMLPQQLDFDQAAEVTAIIKGMPLKAEAKGELQQIVRSRCMGGSSHAASIGTGRAKGQDFESLPNFFSKKFWRLASQMSAQERFGYILQVVIALGGRNLSEYSKALIMVLCIAEDVGSMDGAALYCHYKSYNTMILDKLKSLPEPSFDVKSLPPDFHSLPQELQQAFGDDEPCRCPALDMFKAMAHRVPVRGGAMKVAQQTGRLSNVLPSEPSLTIMTPRAPRVPRLQLEQLRLTFGPNSITHIEQNISFRIKLMTKLYVKQFVLHKTC